VGLQAKARARQIQINDDGKSQMPKDYNFPYHCFLLVLVSPSSRKNAA
jgi:hypothetical protein